MIEAIQRAARLGYKLTFLPSPQGIGIQCREFPDRGPCSTAWLWRTVLSEADAVLAVNMLIESLFETIERLPDCSPTTPINWKPDAE